MSQKKYDLFDHILVPKHILLSKEEAQNMLKQYQVKPYQIPHLKVSDPAVEAIGAKTGDIIKVLRKSLTAGNTISYRYVVA